MKPILFPAGTLALLLMSSFVGCRRQPSSGSMADKSTPAKQEAGSDAAVPTVAVVPVARGAIEQTLPVSGTFTVLRDRQAIVTPAVAGAIEQLTIHSGQQILKGQVIAHLATRALQGQLQQAQATIAQNQLLVQQAQVNVLQQEAQSSSAILQAQSAVGGAKATLAGTQATLMGNEAALKNAEQNLARAQTLFKDGLVAQKDVETAQLALRTAQAQVNAQTQAVDAQRQTVASQETAVRAAQAAALQNLVKRKDVQIATQQVQNARGALATAQAQMALYTIRAPLTGLVTNVAVAVGETVDTTKQLATIMNLDVLQLQIAIPSASAPQVHTGQAISYRIDALPDQIFAGQINSVGTQVDPVNSTVTALARITNMRGRFKDNMSARVWVVLQKHTEALLAPKSAVFFDASGKASVVIIGADDIAHTQEVQTGLADDNSVELLSGVQVGVHLATSGGYGLPDGTKVAVAAANASKKADAP